MDEPLVIDYFTDVLCIWAWIAQRRTEELESVWENKIDVRYRCLDIFGDTAERVGKRWADRRGYEGFGEHVIESAAPYDNTPVNPDIWKSVRPATSANAHLVIKAVTTIESAEVAVRLAAEIRRSFFVDLLDVGQLPVLYEIAAGFGLDEPAIRKSIRNGSAAAALMSDSQLAASYGITGSPSWVMNSGRQKLYGNVTYRVLNANVEGLLSHRGDEASWC